MTHIKVEDIGWAASSTVGAVAAGGAAAVAAGIDSLERGGNAADAAAATILALSITDHGSFAIGGEVPFIIYDAKVGEVKVLSGLGRAPRSQDAIDWYMQHGIPGDGDMKAAPVPAAVDLCVTALKLYGTTSFEQAVAPTLALLDAGGREWYGRLANTLRKMIEAERAGSGSREENLQAAVDRFYRGDIAEDLEDWYVEKGGFLRREDLAAHVTRVEDPVTVEYRGYTVYKCSTWTQGPYLCQALRLLEGYDLKAMGHLSTDAIHVIAEALKLAMADRDEYYGDPLFADVPLDALLSDEYTRIRRALIDMQAAFQEVRPGDPRNLRPLKAPSKAEPWPGGTTTCVVADRWGNVVAATPSCNVFGDKGDGGRTGVTHGNRLRSLNSTEGHPNCIKPGKRPRITLTPTLVLKEGKPVLAISVAGGDLQDQTTLNLLLNFVEYGMMPDAAVTAPRFATAHHQDSFDPQPVRERAFIQAGSLTVNTLVDVDVARELAARGHKLSSTEGAIAAPVMLYVDPDSGIMYAAGDPAARRHAAGVEE
ncbi:MAG: gamma-glutamyltransferase [Chloroflexi bacterium]|nr:gamma-glutamyltransferase [Chloroflexota bacterium]